MARPASSNPIIIVTGGTRGIGRCIAERLHADGYGILFTHSSSDQDAASLERALHSSQRPCRGVKMDITQPDAATRIFDAAAALGHAVGLVNNAGVTGKLGPLADLSDDDLDRVIATNLTATIRLCREAARRWSARTERSSIVNISSVAARTGSPHEYVGYAATKAAVETLTVGLAKELAQNNIHVSAVSPGTIDTTIHARAGQPDRARRVAERIPMKRPGRPEEIAGAVAWLLSTEASYATGCVLNVAGGL